ncbi:MAG: peptidylprolyl isomerase, partial [Planctomycetota bacterium]
QATPVNNTLDDGDVSVTVTATATGFAPDDVAVSITDDDAAALTLTVSPESAAESAGSGAVTFTLSRNSGDVSQALTVNLSSANTSRLTVPATATIPAGQASVTFAGTAVDDSIVNASLTVLVTASATGFVNGTGTVTLTDNDAAAFSLTATPLSLSESDTSPVKFTLQRTGADLSQAVTVQLLSGSTSRFAVPASVTISAGFNQVSFDGNVVNNTAADGNASVSISASAAGYATGQTSVTVNDDEASGPTLALSLSKSALPENAGSDASVLTVTRSNASTASALVVTLTSSNTTRISVPASVTIPAGQTSTTAAIATIDNTAIDGSPTIVMTASATGFANQQTSLIVVDNENAVLSLAFPQTTVPEDAGTLAGTVTSSITSSSDLVVSLAYSDPTVISGPSTVTIPAGQTSTPVTLTVVNGGVLTGSAKAKVAAAAVGAALDVEEITVNDVDDVSITTNISSNTFVQSNGTVITRNSSFVITGTTVPNANITVDSDGDGAYDDASLTADSSGAYSLNVTLTNTNANRGENQIRIRSANGPEFGDTAVNAHLAVGTVVRFATNAGNYDVELLDTAAPGTVANFLAYMNSPKYDNLIVHRSVSDFVVQAGGFTVNNGQITPVTPNAAITNEFKAENSNLRGTLSMAQQAGQPNSGTSQWFVNVANNSFLDNAQHTVFGRVIGTGMSVVDAINDIPVRNINTLYGQTALAEVPLRNPAPVGTQISGTVTTISGSAVITGVGTQFTSQLSAGDSIKIGGTLFFVQSIQSDTSLTLKSSVSFGATLLTVLRDVVPEDADFVVFSDISKILDVI